MTSYQAAQQAARDNRDENRGEATGQAMPERTGSYLAASEQAKTKRQPAVDQSAQVKTMQAALRMQESGSYEGDYTAQGQWIESQSDKPMGAYGIMSKNWDGYTNAAGIPNANWRDARSQDRVAGQMVNKLANQFGGNWGLVASAWFAGSGATQRVVDKYGYQATTLQIGEILGATVGDYATQVVGHGSSIANNPYGIENNLADFSSDVGFEHPSSMGSRGTGNTPQDAVRARLVALAGMGRTETPEPDGFGGNPEPVDGGYDETVRMEEEAAQEAATPAEPTYRVVSDSELTGIEREIKRINQMSRTGDQMEAVGPAFDALMESLRGMNPDDAINLLRNLDTNVGSG